MSSQDYINAMNEKISHLCSFILSKIPGRNGNSPLSTLSRCDDSGYYPIHYLSASGYVDYLRLYLEVINMIPGGKVLIDVRDLNDGSTGLHYAVRHGQIEVTRTLIQAGAAVNVQNFEGKTALFTAVSQFKDNNDRNLVYDIVKALLYFGANPNIGDEDGVSPLHVACSLGIVPLVELLIDNGAWVNIRDVEGDTPIFYALREGKNLIVEKLVDYGVNIEDTNEDGETPLSFCKSIGDEQMENLILSLYPVPPVETISLPGRPRVPPSGYFEVETREKPKLEEQRNVEHMDIDLSICSLSSSAGSRTKLDFNNPNFVSSEQSAF